MEQQIRAKHGEDVDVATSEQAHKTTTFDGRLEQSRTSQESEPGNSRSKIINRHRTYLNRLRMNATNNYRKSLTANTEAYRKRLD